MKHFSLALLPALFAPFAAAQQAPDAGRVLQAPTAVPALPARLLPETKVEETPARVLDAGLRMTLKNLRITGAQAFSEAELQALVADAIGKELSLADLDALANRLTRRYRDAGYLVARAWLPPQDVTDGTVEIAILEGVLGKVEVSNGAGLAPSALAPLEALAPGEAIQRRTLESSLLALADLPGVEVKSTLRPGSAVGAADFLVDVTPRPSFNGSIDADNFGNRFTGDRRLGASLFWNNPAGLGDQASLRAQTSDGDFNYTRLGYQLPFGPHATRVGVSWSEMRYRLGKDFTVLAAHGDASIGSLYLLHPFFRSREASLHGQVQFDDKRLEDKVDATATGSRKTLENWTLALNGSYRDGLAGGGETMMSLATTRGRLGLDEVSAMLDRASARSAGEFTKWSATAQINRLLTGGWILAASYLQQWAGKNLDSSEKFALGGAQGVRAYPQGEGAGDEGHLLALELRWQWNDAWQFQGFYDDGQVKINRDSWTAGNNGLRRAGYGVGATYAGYGFVVRTFAAWKADTGKPTSDIDRSPRLWLQAARYF